MMKKVGLTLFATAVYLPAVAQQKTAPFTITELVAPHVVADMEVINFLQAETPAIMVRGQDDNKNKLFSFYEVGSNAPDRTVRMPTEALYFDFAEVIEKDKQSLLFLDSSGVQIYDPESDEISRLVEVESIYKQDGSPLFSEKDFARDFNGDGLADLLIPDFDGYHLFLNDGTGGFEEEYLLDMQVEMRLSEMHSTPRYSQFPAYSLDANFDGRPDIAFQKDKAFVTFLQKPDGSFETTPVNVAFDIDIVGNSFAAQVASNERYADQTDLAETVIETIEDLNDDGIMDIVTQTDRAQGLFNRSSKYGFHYGYESNGLLSFNKEPDALINLDGITANPRHIDFASDGRVDFAGGAVNIGIGKIIGILLSGSVGIPVHFYPQNEDGSFSTKPAYKRKVSVDFDMSSGQSSVPVVEMTDIDLDGYKDLILSKEDDRLRVYKATPDKKKMFSSRYIEMQVRLPKNGEQVEVADLNGDGKGDIMLHYDRLGADGPERRNKVLVLLAN